MRVNSNWDFTSYLCIYTHVEIESRMIIDIRKNLQEEWDASTVSSNISRMRMQNRLEATTRRERALAYAFSQQVLKFIPKRVGLLSCNR